MGLQLIEPDEDIDDPTDHPHVNEDRAPPLSDEDPDADRYVIGVKGSDAAVKFFQSVFLENLDDDLYRSSERGEARNLSVFGIEGDDIWEVIEVFNAAAEAIEDVRIVGTVEGTEYEMEVWDGELLEEPLFTTAES